jgi:hypothetical protein
MGPAVLVRAFLLSATRAGSGLVPTNARSPSAMGLQILPLSLFMVLIVTEVITAVN